MSIKPSLGKLDIPLPMTNLYRNHIMANDFEILPLTFDCLQIIHDLPFYHNDPFDRMIIAQSISKNIPILGCDNAFKNYDVQCFWE
ncbi:type II toxin-antitoxin system VapC family toxin [Moraxella lacunata]|uniref:type II toxin-antitoxin system VapC family toxin n=1 Tax=Moraxella lacunata TaxID=477 RepID=UPI000B21C71A|nr:type II toxin-antitoxin system VapC family toxin [Moraxella lacunata]